MSETYTSSTPHIHLLSSKVINHGRDIGFVPANNQFADELLSIAQQLMSDGIVNTSQDDVGAPFRLNSINVAYVSSWTRPSNCIMVNLVKDMIPVRNMNLRQILRAGVSRRDSVCPTSLLDYLPQHSWLTIARL